MKMFFEWSNKKKIGSWYVGFRQNDVETTACLHQIRVIDYRRIFSKLGRLDDSDYAKIKDRFTNLYLG